MVQVGGRKVNKAAILRAYVPYVCLKRLLCVISSGNCMHWHEERCDVQVLTLRV